MLPDLLDEVTLDESVFMSLRCALFENVFLRRCRDAPDTHLVVNKLQQLHRKFTLNLFLKLEKREWEKQENGHIFKVNILKAIMQAGHHKDLFRIRAKLW